MNYSINYLFKRSIEKLCNPKAVRGSTIDKTAYISSGCIIVNSKIGKFSYLGENCSAAYTDIGAFCSIGVSTIIGGGSHPLDWVSTSPVFCKGRNVLQRNLAQLEFDAFRKTIIGNDIWIGSCCLIKSGVTIGDGAIIGMGSVVTKDVEPYSIVAGNPARMLRKRFDDETIQSLLELKWWEKDDKWFVENANKFNNVNALV